MAQRDTQTVRPDDNDNNRRPSIGLARHYIVAKSAENETDFFHTFRHTLNFVRCACRATRLLKKKKANVSRFMTADTNNKRYTYIFSIKSS